MPRPSALRSFFALAATLTLATSAHAQLRWDPALTGPTTGASGGTGTWTSLATTLNWYDSGANADVAWNSQIAVFGGTAGTVTVDAANPVAATGLKFNTDGYTITAGTLTLTGPGTITATAGATGTTINSVIAGSAGLTKAGAGTLTLGGTNTFTGTVAVTAGTLGVAADANLGAAANDLTLAAGTLATSATFTTARAVTLGTGGRTVGPATGTTLRASGKNACATAGERRA